MAKSSSTPQSLGMRHFIAYFFMLSGCAPAPPVARPSSAPPVALRPGQAAFESTCATCHQASGLGIPGNFPPLAGSEWVLGKPDIPIAIVLRGLQGALKVRGNSYSNTMPPHRDLLKDEQIAAILTYVRSSWGNSAGPVTAAQVAGVRKRVGPGEPLWQAELDKFRP